MLTTDTTNRSITFEEAVGEKFTDSRGDECRAFLTITVSHDVSRKRYVVFLDRELRGPMFTTRIIDYGSGAPNVVRQFRYGVTATGRYNLPTLKRIMDDVMTDWYDQPDVNREDAREWAKSISRD